MCHCCCLRSGLFKNQRSLCIRITHESQNTIVHSPVIVGYFCRCLAWNHRLRIRPCGRPCTHGVGASGGSQPTIEHLRRPAHQCWHAGCFGANRALHLVCTQQRSIQSLATKDTGRIGKRSRSTQGAAQLPRGHWQALGTRSQGRAGKVIAWRQHQPDKSW